ncbi:MAG TPA: hypothetical protein VGP82_25125 [Ktedonobacterales bacterium]|nr:hypothetical protein [Ktedonobacterales bacterium]
MATATKTNTPVAQSDERQTPDPVQRAKQQRAQRKAEREAACAQEQAVAGHPGEHSAFSLSNQGTPRRA